MKTEIILLVCRVWQGMALGIAVDLSALPYLLRLILGPLLRGRPRSVVPDRLPPYRSEKSCKQRFGVFPVRKGGRSQTMSPP